MAQILDSAGEVTPASMFLLIHHGLRRDAARYPAAVAALGPADGEAAAELAGSWAFYADMLDRHHRLEDDLIFPLLLAEEPALAGVLARLDAEHHELDVLLAEVARVLPALPEPGGVREGVALFTRLKDLLDAHLDTEEEHLVPVMNERSADGLRLGDRTPPPPPAEALPWIEDGLDPAVAERVFATLPEGLRARLPELRAEYRRRSTFLREHPR
ncbi:hemerythrin domain-containing protein [Rhizohabitans arisaemae]|uniref:hemerythrin domain-containing protein n=1 Tax=Rhizohabitans arisaemae TaxID=2720610 RepID=UPI0024B184E4|nr:hemerythrin domain-containing protein [Rhizohabitans arisaemae]